jgi:hypothetical protein
MSRQNGVIELTSELNQDLDVWGDTGLDMLSVRSPHGNIHVHTCQTVLCQRMRQDATTVPIVAAMHLPLV